MGQECQLFVLILQGHWDTCACACAVGKAVPTVERLEDQGTGESMCFETH